MELSQRLTATYIRGYQAALRGGAATWLLDPEANVQSMLLERAYRTGYAEGRRNEVA